MGTLHPYVVALEKFVRAGVASAEDRESLLGDITKYGPAITNDPRDQTEANREILCVTLETLFAHAEMLYGEGIEMRRFPYPRYVDHPNSLIAPLINEPTIFAVVVSKFVDSWEATFYEVAHESIHFLEPVTDVKNNPVATLDEAVAVLFAEAMYQEHITAYLGLPPQHSPLKGLHGVDEPYLRGHHAIRNVSNMTLRTLRQSFGAFSRAFDAAGILEIAGEELSMVEAEVLAAPFDYSFQRTRC